MTFIAFTAICNWMPLKLHGHNTTVR